MSDSRVDANRQELRRESLRPSRSNVDSSGRIIVPRSSGTSKSPFQKVLDNQSASVDSSSEPGADSVSPRESKDRFQPVQRSQEHPDADRSRFQEKVKEKEKEKTKEEFHSRDSKGADVSSVKEADRKVVARASVSERKGQGRQGQNSQQFGSGMGGKKGRTPLPSLVMKKGPQDASKGMGERKQTVFEGVLGQKMTPPVLKQPSVAGKSPMKEIPKILLDQIVQYCRLTTKTDGDKEFDLQLHENIFKGLRLKVALVKGRIQATFMTSSSEVCQLFEAHKSSLKELLTQKGIDVASIHVINSP